MASRKRGRQEMEAAEAFAAPTLLDRIRNMWEFANLAQYLSIFGKAVKVEEGTDIEDLETECLKQAPSQKLAEIGLALLKFVSSHRGLTPDIFEEYARRQYRSKLPDLNPFGDEETPLKFNDLDIFTRIRVLFQLSQWTMNHCDRIREKMPEQKDADQTYWRIEPTGWDSKERTYFVLDDNRLYRQTEPPPPAPPAVRPKKNSKKAKAALRASKRRKTSGVELENGDHADDEADGVDGVTQQAVEPDRFGGRKWELVAITLDHYRKFMDSIRRSKDADEKLLYQQIEENILPVVEKAEESLQRKAAKKQRELLAMEKLATAKRSSRIAGKMEKQKEEEDAIEAEKKKRADLAMAHKEQEKLKKMELERESRIATRETRVREREMRRILHEEELANLSEENKKLETGEGRLSERHLKAEMEKRRKAIEELAEEDDWMFDCSGCGVHGENLDDGSGIISCEKCNVWQHLACLELSQEAAEDETFHFVCKMCKRRQEDKEKSAKNPIKLDFRKLGSSASPPSEKKKQPHAPAEGSMAQPQTGMGGERKAKRGRSSEASRSPSPTKRAKLEHATPSTTTTAPNGVETLKHHDETNHADSITTGAASKNIMNGPGLSPSGQYTRSPASTSMTSAGGPNGIMGAGHHSSPILPPAFSGSIPPKSQAPPPKKSPPPQSQPLTKINGVLNNSPNAFVAHPSPTTTISNGTTHPMPITSSHPQGRILSQPQHPLNPQATPIQNPSFVPPTSTPTHPPSQNKEPPPTSSSLHLDLNNHSTLTLSPSTHHPTPSSDRGVSPVKRGSPTAEAGGTPRQLFPQGAQARAEAGTAAAVQNDVASLGNILPEGNVSPTKKASPRLSPGARPLEIEAEKEVRMEDVPALSPREVAVDLTPPRKQLQR